MTQPFIKERLFCPGPTPVSIEAKLASISASVYHRTQEFYDAFLRCRNMLAPIFGSKNAPIILTASGTGAMEAAMTNLTHIGDKVLTINAGKFGERWSKMAQAYQCDTVILDVKWGEVPTEDQIASILKQNPDIKAVFFQANETSTGVAFPTEKLAKCIKKHSSALVVVDAISALGAHKIEMDVWGIDCLLSGSQKGFGIPPGLAFIALSDQAWEQISPRPKFYFDLRKEKKGQDEGSTAWTPATSLIASLEVALQEMHKVGLEQVYAHHTNMTQAVRAGVRSLGMSFLAEAHYSHALTAFYTPPEISASAVLKKLKSEYGMVFAGGQDALSGKIIRFAHLGFADRFDILSGMAALEFALHDNGFNHFKLGQGVSAVMQEMRVK